jgi:hypothetical protein
VLTKMHELKEEAVPALRADPKERW